jgi:hypothetical protein
MTTILSEVSMGPGLTVFILFFGIALLDALRGGEWPRVAFWLAVGALFFILERKDLFRRTPRV